MDEHKKVWEDIAQSYEQVIIRTSFYKRFMQDVLDGLPDPSTLDTIVDLGCGVGYLMNELLKRGARRVIGVDANDSMLEMARDNVIDPVFKDRYELIHADGTTFSPAKHMRKPEHFDVVISTNVLFTLADPFAYLDNAYALLKPGGTLAVSSAEPSPDLELNIKMARKEFAAAGTLTGLEKYVAIVESLNKHMMSTDFKTFTLPEMEDILKRFIGFSSIKHAVKTYNGQNFLISATKPSQPISIEYVITRDAKDFDDALSLKYHLLHDRLQMIPSNAEKKCTSEYDAHSTCILAREKPSNRLIAMIKLVEDSNLGLPVEENVDLSKFRRKYKRLACLDSWYAYPSFPNPTIGPHVLAYSLKLAREKGIDCICSQINPPLKRFMNGIGAVSFGKERTTKDANAFPILDIYFDLTQGRVLEINDKKLLQAPVSYEKILFKS